MGVWAGDDGGNVVITWTNGPSRWLHNISLLYWIDYKGKPPICVGDHFALACDVYKLLVVLSYVVKRFLTMDSCAMV